MESTRYLTTTYENFGVITQVDSLQGYCYVVGEIGILSFIRRQKPHLVSFDGERAYTEHPEELAKVAVSNNNYEFIFIPVEAQEYRLPGAENPGTKKNSGRAGEQSPNAAGQTVTSPEKGGK